MTEGAESLLGNKNAFKITPENPLNAPEVPLAPPTEMAQETSRSPKEQQDFPPVLLEGTAILPGTNQREVHLTRKRPSLFPAREAEERANLIVRTFNDYLSAEQRERLRRVVENVELGWGPVDFINKSEHTSSWGDKLRRSIGVFGAYHASSEKIVLNMTPEIISAGSGLVLTWISLIKGFDFISLVAPLCMFAFSMIDKKEVISHELTHCASFLEREPSSVTRMAADLNRIAEFPAGILYRDPKTYGLKDIMINEGLTIKKSLESSFNGSIFNKAHALVHTLLSFSVGSYRAGLRTVRKFHAGIATMTSEEEATRLENRAYFCGGREEYRQAVDQSFGEGTFEVVSELLDRGQAKRALRIIEEAKREMCGPFYPSLPKKPTANFIH